MADFATFGQLKDRVREGLADFTDTFYTSTEIGLATNEGVWEIYKLLQSAHIGFFLADWFTFVKHTILNESTYYQTIFP